MPGLEAGLCVFGWKASVDFDGCFSRKGLMRPMFVVPSEIQSQLGTDEIDGERDEHSAEAFAFDRPNEPLDDGDAAVPADRAVTPFDPLALTPVPERFAVELLAPVADDVLWAGPYPAHGAAQERPDLQR